MKLYSIYLVWHIQNWDLGDENEDDISHQVQWAIQCLIPPVLISRAAVTNYHRLGDLK